MKFVTLSVCMKDQLTWCVDALCGVSMLCVVCRCSVWCVDALCGVHVNLKGPGGE